MKFTIGLPITKTEFLAETLDSLSAQTYEGFELVIRNNAKDQQTKTKIKAMVAPWLEKPGVVYLETEQQVGMIENFNGIVEAARGKYITILSDDDVMEADYLKEFDRITEKYPKTFVFHCRFRHIDESSQMLKITENYPEFESCSDFLFHYLNGHRAINLSNFLVNTEELKKIGGFTTVTEAYGVDNLTWFALSKNGVGFVNRPLLNYRVSTINYSNSVDKLLIRLDDIRIMKQEIEKFILSEDFRSDSAYPIDYLLHQNEESFKLDIKSTIYDIALKLNTPEFLAFYFKNRKRHYFPKKVLFKNLALKLMPSAN